MTHIEKKLAETREGLAMILATESGRKMFEEYTYQLDMLLEFTQDAHAAYTGRLNRRYVMCNDIATKAEGVLCGIINALAVSFDLLGYDLNDHYIRVVLNEQAYEYNEEMKYFDMDCQNKKFRFAA